MNMDFTIRLTSQLREHLRALRKARGLTQAALGQLLGIGQARVAEIENNPGVVSVDQLMKVLSALRASLVLRDDVVEVVAERPDTATLHAPVQANKAKKPAKQSSANIPPPGQWRMTPLSSSGRRQETSVLASRSDTRIPSDAQALQDTNPPTDVTATSRRNFVIRAKKGSW
jgi:HTH-type transcriptional regulator/antitoxin HipB